MSTLAGLALPNSSQTGSTPQIQASVRMRSSDGCLMPNSQCDTAAPVTPMRSPSELWVNSAPSLACRRRRQKLFGGTCMTNHPDLIGDYTNSIVERMSRHCQYPIGEPRTPGFRWCGRVLAEGERIYCQEHRRLCSAGRPLRGVSAP